MTLYLTPDRHRRGRRADTERLMGTESSTRHSRHAGWLPQVFAFTHEEHLNIKLLQKHVSALAHLSVTPLRLDNSTRPINEKPRRCANLPPISCLEHQTFPSTIFFFSITYEACHFPLPGAASVPHGCPNLPIWKIWICSFKWKTIQNDNIQLYVISSELFFSTAVISCVFLHKCRWIMTIQTRESAFVQETSFFLAPSVSADVNCSPNPVSTQRCVQKPHPGCRTRTSNAGFSGHDSWSNWPWLKPAVAHLLLAVPPSAPMCPSLFSRK